MSRGARVVATSPIVIGHRGASGYRPEHTLASYEVAIDLGADFVEPDLVSTKDGVLVARHENEITGSTDVAGHPEFAPRRTTKVIDGNPVSGWFTEDFTLAELKTLRARERLPDLRPANCAHDGLYEIPTLEEVIDLVDRRSMQGRPIGIYPETKHPAHFRSIGLPLEEPLVASLHRSGFPNAAAPVFIQSFEVASLKQLAGLTNLPLVQLLDSEAGLYQRASAAAFAEIAIYAVGVGVHKDLVIPRDGAGNLAAPTTLVDDAHAASLIVHAWTFRAENRYLPTNLRRGDTTDPTYPSRFGDWRAEYEAFIAAGVDGLFSDQPELAVTARDGLTGWPSRAP